MGLHANAEHGAKALLKARFPKAFRTYSSLGEVRKALHMQRENIVAALDGNVLMMQVPREAATFEAYVSIVANAIKTTMGSAAVVVVVFDEPAVLSVAKREEQNRRDANKKRKLPVCSADMTPFPTTDDYNIETLQSSANVHDITGCRPARNRLFDEVGKEVLRRLSHKAAEWERAGFGSSHLLFDGLDPRGAARPLGEPRQPCIFGTDASLAELFAHEAAGEGDLKLALIEERVRSVASLPEEERHASLKNATLHLSVTIDTDSIAIELLERGRRGASSATKGLLCMRERANKRDGDEASAVYTCVDYDLLFRLLQSSMWRHKTPSADEERLAIALLTTGWALAGSDFVSVGGLRADLVTDAMPALLRTAPRLLALMRYAWCGERRDVAKMVPALKRLVYLCAENYADTPRARKAAVASMKEVGWGGQNEPLLRAAWLAAYWSGCEIKGDLCEFGFSA
jgi:hypothetical protein